MVSSGECVTEEVGTEKLQSPDAGSHALQQISDSKSPSSQSDQGGGTTLIKSEKDQLLDIVVHTSQSEQGGKASSMISKKMALTASPLPGTEGSSPIVREKASEDGYNWRKYGQKLVKGNEFVRSYYKCTHPNCQVKKQLEHSHDGKMVDTVYFGQHDHPTVLNLPLAVGVVVSVVEERPDNASPTVVKDKPLDAHTPPKNEPRDGSLPLVVVTNEDVKGAPSKSNRIQSVADSDNDHLISKRRKKENSNAGASLVEKPSSESRMVVKTLSEVDIVNDGYRWRKYGQKLVKGNPNPRSYYRCSSPGCPVKKHVERASQDAKMVITTYEGRHEHDLPPTRTVTHNTTGLSVHSAVHNDQSGTKVEESKTVCLDVVVYSNSEAENKSCEQLNGDSITKSEVTGSKERWSWKLDPTKESDAVQQDVIVNGKSSSQNTSNEQLMSGKLEIKSENDVVCIDKMVQITPRSECSFDEQRMPSTEPVQS